MGPNNEDQHRYIYVDIVARKKKDKKKGHHTQNHTQQRRCHSGDYHVGDEPENQFYDNSQPEIQEHSPKATQAGGNKSQDKSSYGHSAPESSCRGTTGKCRGVTDLCHKDDNPATNGNLGTDIQEDEQRKKPSELVLERFPRSS